MRSIADDCQLTDFDNQVVKEVKPEIVPVIPPIIPEITNLSQDFHTPQKPSKIGLDIEKLGEETGIPITETAKYTPISNPQEVQKAKDFIQTSPETFKEILAGNQELPEGMMGGAFIDATRDYLSQNPDKEIIELAANSPLISETSRIAQELQILKEIDPDSFFAQIKEVKNIKQAQAEKTTKLTTTGIKKQIQDKVKQSVIDKLLKNSKANSPLIKALKSGELTIEQLISMDSPTRIQVLTNYLGEKAIQANLEFEKKQILKHIETGISNWIQKYGFIGRYDPEKITSIKQMALKWKQQQQERVFNPKEYETFLGSLAEKQIGTAITKEEASKIWTLTNQLETYKKSWDSDNRQWLSKQDQADYGATKRLLQNYIESIKNPNAIKDLAIRRLNEFRATIKDNPPKAIFDLLKDTIRGISDLSISLVANIDNSFIGRQGIKVLYTSPSVWSKAGLNSISNIIETLQSGDKVWDAILADYYSRPNNMSGAYKIAGIEPRDFERFPSTLPERIPVSGRIFKASEIAFKGSDMEMRMNLYDLWSKIQSNNGVDMTDKTNIKALGTIINSLVGKGQWGKPTEGAMRLVLWAPRMLKGNIDVLTAHLGQDLPPFARKLAWTNWFKIIGSLVTILSISRAIDKDSVELTPYSSNSGKIMIGENHDFPIDISGGAMSLVNLASKVITGKSKSTRTGKVSDLWHPEYGGQTLFDVLISFLEGKTTPLIHSVINILNNELYGGKKVTFERVIRDLITPISIENAIDIKDAKDNDKLTALWATIMDIFGFNSSTPLQSIKYSQPINKEIKRLQNAGQDKAQTSFISGFMQENTYLSIKDNKEIFDKITALANNKIGHLIKSEKYQKLDDGEKAKTISSFLDRTKYEIYKAYVIKEIQGLAGAELGEKIQTLKRAKILTKEIFDDLVSEKKINPNDLKGFIKTPSPDYPTGTETSPKSLIHDIFLYAKAIGIDAFTAFDRIFTGQRIRRIDNNTIIVERMPLSESQKTKEKMGSTGDMILDHTIPLELGGSNSESNLKLVPYEDWKSYTPIENYLGELLRANKITKKQARKAILDFKNKKITAEEIRAKYK